MDRPTPADEFRRAVAVALADAPIRLAQDEAECDAWAGYAQFTNGLRCNLCRDDTHSLQSKVAEAHEAQQAFRYFLAEPPSGQSIHRKARGR